MNFQNTLSNYKVKLDNQLELFLGEKQEEAKNTHPFIKESVDNLKEYVLRGSAKRIRGGLINVGYKAFSGEDNNEILKISCAVELAHAYFLIHDDIIDQDVKRRGGDSMHEIYRKVSEKAKFRSNSEHFGKSIAIIIGDLCASFGYDTILQSSFTVERKLKALKRFNDMVTETCYGQVLDVVGAEKMIEEKDIIDIYLSKTARYTIETPLHIGAILAGATDEQLGILSEYALPVGVVYQLNNDMSEVFTTEDKIDSKTASDIQEGKQPLFIIRALLKANTQQKKTILNLLGKKGITKEAVKELQDIIRDTGALTYCDEFAKNKVIEAKNALKKLTFKHAPAHLLLEELGDYVLNIKF